MGRRLPTQIEWQRINAATLLRLVSTELDLAITFCAIAVATSDPARSLRNVANAQRAHASATKYLNVGLNARESREICEKLARLESLLAGFGRGGPQTQDSSPAFRD